MSKQYGLILCGQQKKLPSVAAPKQGLLSKPSIFNESSSDEDDDNISDYRKMQQTRSKKTPIGPGAMEKRMARNLQEKALAEDPTIFQYDELYDDIERKRISEQKLNTKKEPQKPKYISRLMQTAEKRKLEAQLRIERQVQKEREAEGDKYKDKESFVTPSYRKKLEEMRKLEEQNERDSYLEAIGDVRKQQNLDGFYRHLYEQKMNSEKGEIDDRPTTSKCNSNTVKENINEAALCKPSSSKVHRSYRKRKYSDDEEKEDSENSENKQQNQTAKSVKTKTKEHLTNNIDADSDFSIDDSSSDDGSDKEEEEAKGKCLEKQKTSDSAQDSIDTVSQIPSKTIAINLNSLRKTDVEEKNVKDVKKATEESKTMDETKGKESSETSKPKPDKSDIWRKRTVGAVFEAAVQRYFARKAAKCSS